MQAIAQPVKYPTINVSNFVESYRLTLARYEDEWQSEYGSWWSGGVFIRGAEADTEAIEEAAWDEWWQYLTDTIESIEDDHDLFSDSENPLYPGYCLLMHRRLTELAEEIAPLITDVRRGEILLMARGYALPYAGAVTA